VIKKPTKEMIDFYEQRTAKHINRVKENCITLSNYFNNPDLSRRGYVHDLSKYSEAEYIPYVWMTWYYKMKDKGFEYPKGVENAVSKAWDHHKSMNDHHPEYWNNVQEMSDNSLFEMCCDITAMSQEFGDDPVKYFNNNHKERFNFSQNQLNKIYNGFEILNK